ncbi:MAG: D-alanyl-D-alanine carboxypeptidase [Microcoleaceae cyanobacterium]
MLEVFSSGAMSLWLEMAKAEPMELDANSRKSWETRLADVMLLNESDAIAEATVQQYLNRLSSRNLPTDVQGVWLQTGPTSLADNVGTKPLPAASLTKVATSLAVLQQWRPEHQFETMVGITGPVVNGIVQGDLAIVGGGDPLFVWEEAFALGNSLNQMGITGVSGNLVITGNFSMNYESDWAKAGQLLKQALDAKQWPVEAQIQYRERMPANTPQPQVTIAGTIQSFSSSAQAQPIIRHRSLPLAEILKQMNIYSNNLMAEMLAQNVGGAAVVRQQAAQTAGVPVEEIVIINGSGLGHENQISPRAVVAMFMALQRELESTQWNIADLFPVSGRDLGTLEFRKIPKHTPVKTGSLFDVSALAGALPTRDRGIVWFAVINRGEGLDNLRDHQDWLLQQLVSEWGAPATLPQDLQPKIDGKRPTLGDSSRNEILQL